MKVMLRCTTVDSGVVCAVPHLYFSLMRPLQSVDNWVMVMLAEVQDTTGPAPPLPISLAMAVRAVWIPVELVAVPAPVPIASMWCAENPVSGVCKLLLCSVNYNNDYY